MLDHVDVAFEPPTLNFLHLPSVVLMNIFDYLRACPTTLKTLRSVCQATKEWVEMPKYFQKVTLFVKEEERLEEIMTAPWVAPWATAIVYANLCTEILIPFLQQCKSSLVFLCITNKDRRDSTSTKYEILVSDLKLILLNLGPRLEYLRISAKVVNFRGLGCAAENGDEWNDFFKTHGAILKENFRGLKSLYTEELNEGSDVPVESFLTNMFKICTNLTKLGLPYLHPGAITTQPARAAQIHSLPDLLRNRFSPPPPSRWGQQSRQPELSVYFGSTRTHVLRLLEFPFQFSLAFSVSPDMLLELCKYPQIKIFNVPNHLLPSVFGLTEKVKLRLDDSVHSVVCTNVSNIRSGDIYLPKRCKLHMLYNFPYARIPEFSIPPSMHISGFELLCKGDVAVDLEPKFFHDVFQVCRPTVKKLHLIWVKTLGEKSVKLSSVFPNLRQLYMSYFKNLDCLADDGLLGGLDDLEYLRLSLCEWMDAKCMKGPELLQQLFKKFKRMRKCTIYDCSFMMTDGSMSKYTS